MNDIITQIEQQGTIVRQAAMLTWILENRRYNLSGRHLNSGYEDNAIYSRLCRVDRLARMAWARELRRHAKLQALRSSLD